MTTKRIIYLLITIVIIFLILFYFFGRSGGFNTSIENSPTLNLNEEETVMNMDFEGENLKIINEGERQEAFSGDNLRTNTSIRSIELDEVLGGGPGKDGIPAILNPKFISISESPEPNDRLGLVVTVGNTSRFYPYSILVWHEIVNDNIEGQDVLVTFCPLCGSGIVFDPKVNGTNQTFGVSGKLWQSNLLMYDHQTESLWSQSIGKAVVGDYTGETLEVIPSQLITFSEFKDKYSNGEVLSRDTGYFRNYNLYPYGDYEETESVLFPINIKDTRLPAKEIMYIVNFEDKSVAFSRNDLVAQGEVDLEVNGKNIKAVVDGGEIEVLNNLGEIVPGYHEMWFSWATHHQDNGIVWTRE